MTQLLVLSVAVCLTISDARPTISDKSAIQEIKDGMNLIDELLEDLKFEEFRQNQTIGRNKESKKTESKPPAKPESPGTAAAEIPCPPGYVFLPKVKGCYRPMYKPTSWRDALDHCRDLHPGSHLVTLDTATEELHMHNMLHTYGIGDCVGFWTSCLQVGVGSELTWQWFSTGQQLHYDHWSPGRPDNHHHGNQDLCLEMTAPWLLWSDVACTINRCYVCEVLPKH